MLRIIGGEFKRQRLEGPAGGETTRPMSGLVKEAIFNLLRGWFDDANVLDLFAGVGTMGLEAVSRGAKRVLMVEQNRQSFRTLQENIRRLGCEDRAEAMHGDAFSPLLAARAPTPVDVVFVDPPYAMMLDENDRRRVFQQIAMLKDVMAEKGWVVLRSPDLEGDVDLSLPGFEGPETHRYSRDMLVHLYLKSQEDERAAEEGDTLPA